MSNLEYENSDLEYEKKYLKYKTKYLNLRNISIEGGTFKPINYIIFKKKEDINDKIMDIINPAIKAVSNNGFDGFNSSTLDFNANFKDTKGKKDNYWSINVDYKIPQIISNTKVPITIKIDPISQDIKTIFNTSANNENSKIIYEYICKQIKNIKNYRLKNIKTACVLIPNVDPGSCNFLKEDLNKNNLDTQHLIDAEWYGIVGKLTKPDEFKFLYSFKVPPVKSG